MQPADTPATERLAHRAECGRTAPLTRGDGSPQGWRDVVQTCSATELNELAEKQGRGITPQPAGISEQDDDEYDNESGRQ